MLALPSNTTVAALLLLHCLETHQERERIHSRFFKHCKGQVEKDEEIGDCSHNPVVIEIIKPVEKKAVAP